MRLLSFIIILLPLTLACQNTTNNNTGLPIVDSVKTTTINPYDSIFAKRPEFISDGFDYPVGPPDAKGYYDAQPFTKNTHLGEDWNGKGGGNTDLGDTVYAAANGYISSIFDYGGGWGNVIRIIHKLPNGKYIETLYAHEKDVFVESNTFIKRGAPLGTMGNLDGKIYSHLHFEMRTTIDMDLGGGYSTDTTGYISPKNFINKNRPKR